MCRECQPEELKLLLRLVPTATSYGCTAEYRHLVRHRALAPNRRHAAEDTFLLEAGTFWKSTRERRTHRRARPGGRVFVDGKGSETRGRGAAGPPPSFGRRAIVAILGSINRAGTHRPGPDHDLARVHLEEQGQAYLERAKSIVLETLQQITAESRPIRWK